MRMQALPMRPSSASTSPDPSRGELKTRTARSHPRSGFLPSASHKGLPPTSVGEKIPREAAPNVRSEVDWLGEGAWKKTQAGVPDPFNQLTEARAEWRSRHPRTH